MPATKSPIMTLSVAAVAAISEHQAVGYDGDVAGAGEAIQGLAATDAANGQIFGVDVIGTSIAIAGAGVVVGAALEVGAGGKLVTKTSGVTVARALQAANTDGDLFEVLLIPA